MSTEKFFRKSDWIACWTTFAVSLIVYIATLQPTVGLEDSGELIVASDYLGVPHPPGYPIWTVLTWFFQWVFHGVTFSGHPNPAWAVNLFSAVAGAAACGALALLISRSGVDLLRSLSKESNMLGEKTESLFCSVAGISGGLLLAFGHGMWSQSVIAEVYSLNIFFQSLVLVFLYRWMSQPERPKWLLLCAFVFGLGITNHQTLMFMGLAIAIGILFRNLSLFRDFALVGILLLIVVIAQKGLEVQSAHIAEQLKSLVATNAKIAAAVKREGLMQAAWHNGPNHAGFWTFIIPMISIPILLAIKPKTLYIALISLSFLLFFVGIDRYAKSQIEHHEKRKEQAKATDLSPLQEKSPVHALRISSMEVTVNGVDHTLTGTKNPVLVSCVIFLLLVPVFLSIRIPNGQIVCLAYLALLAGFSFYLYMPISSDQNPPINWGYPRTWQGFMHAITRGQYEQVKVAQVLANPAHFIHQCESFFSDLRSQYLPLILTGFLPFAAWRIKRFNAALAAISMFIAAAILLTSSTLIAFKVPDAPGLSENLNKAAIPFVSMLFLLSGIGFGISIANFVESSLKKAAAILNEGNLSFWNFMTALVAGAFGLVLVTGLVILDSELIKNLFQHGAGQTIQENLIIALTVLLPPCFIIGSYLLKRWEKTELSFEINPFGQHWFITTIVAFVAVGIVFIVLQNPKTDIQSLFIGRVQYIQSHAVYAVWMGYGLLLTMAYVDALMKNRSLARYVIILGILALPAFLVVKNRIDPNQLKIYGCADQNGHDFGWQFGNWQLQGVKGIEEDLRAWHSPEEFEQIWAAYPNKNYPEPMGTNAIFFGGTDPGRFVPTYMIYSAKVRPDVYLITQNALADNTYMNVMRDLYGDQIWIPSPIDNNLAFQMYMKNDGANATTEDGKVQVQGVQAVMKINGYLSKMIFDHNQYRTETKTDGKTRPPGAAAVYGDPTIDAETGLPPMRTFYVEESYALPWMYPYLTPHGLIMKINNKPTPLTAEMIKNDTDFWNWYCDRLLNDEKFIRDIVARKTFSKLRGSIAGLYAARGKPKEAEAAFRQAVSLYDLSPEANYHLANLLAQQGRFDEAIELFNVFLEKDSNNEQARKFRKQLAQHKSANNRKQLLEKKLQNGTLSSEEAMDLCETYLSLGLVRQAEALCIQELGKEETTPQTAMQIARIMAKYRRLNVVEQALRKYTVLVPNDGHGWINLAALEIIMGKQGEMWTSLQKAVETGGESARTTLRKDQRFNPIRNTSRFKKLVPDPSEKIDVGLLPGFQESM